MSELEPGMQTPEDPSREAAASALPPPPAPSAEREPDPSIVEEAPKKPADRPAKRSTGTFVIGALSGCALAIFGMALLVALGLAMKSDSDPVAFGTNKVAIIPIDGEIGDARDTIEAIHRYAENSAVRAIVMHINSPGGAIAPSQEIYEEIRKTRGRSGKPIVASLDSVAASGGFYIASACDEIVADPGTITGSIGVILEWMDVHDLLTWAKLKNEAITSGTLKSAGSPYRPMTDTERAYFQRIVAQLHVQFVKAVAVGRKGKISENEVSRLADGRVFTGEEALSLKLVDHLGNLDDAVALAGRLGGVKGRPSTLYPRRRRARLMDLLSRSDDAETMIHRVLSGGAARFLYRW
ncbi:MAG: signal peptide peptidase SppA [Nitrospirota bacterium]